MAVYLISSKNVGPQDEALVEREFRVQTEPGLTNMDHAPRVSGWLGTTNDRCEYALGEFDTVELALEQAAELAKENDNELIAPSELGYEEAELAAIADSAIDADGLDVEPTLLALRWEVPIGVRTYSDVVEWLEALSFDELMDGQPSVEEAANSVYVGAKLNGVLLLGDIAEAIEAKRPAAE